tara:strand:+ start:120 stop:464 length:345 start_codon:yes stop_codon:yes gene_type:complete
MKTVLISAKDFTELVYPAVSGDAPGTVKELVLVIGLLEKLEEASVVQAASFTGDEGNEVLGEIRTYDDATLSQEFVLENEEATYLSGRLVELLPKINAGRSRTLIPLLNALQKE